MARLYGQPSDRNEQNNKPKQQNNDKKENKKKIQNRIIGSCSLSDDCGHITATPQSAA
jgi:hypothetical protein